MRKNKLEKKLLLCTLILNFGVLLPIIHRKSPIKDWIIVYLFNAVTNGIIDNALTKNNIIKYPNRLFPKIFDTHILFDFFLYPTFTILYNQMTAKDKTFAIIYKLFVITIPVFFIEFLAERKTNLVEWTKKWRWYHTFFSIIIKSLLTRLIIALIRRIDANKENSDRVLLKERGKN
jgi:hypothetical protein